MSTRRIQGSTIAPRTLSAGPAPAANTAGTWVRNKAWPALAVPASNEQKVVGLYAIWPGDGTGTGGNWFAVQFSGDYTVDFGDGTSVNTASATATYKTYNFNDVDLYDATVTLTDAGDIITRTAHGYNNGDTVRFYRITSTTGISENQAYFVVNATADTFQVSQTINGAAVTLTTDGSASLLPYKIAVITITPQAGQNFTSVDLSTKHNESGLQNYCTGWLDIAISAPNATSIRPSTSFSAFHGVLERFNLVAAGAFSSCVNWLTGARNLREVLIPFGATSAVTSMNNMFSNCSALATVPLFNTAAVTDMGAMFNGCSALTTVPLFNTGLVTSMSNMFGGCSALESVPLLNTVAVTNMGNMFSGCSALVSVPLFNTSAATNMGTMFNGCRILTLVPLFNTAAATNMSSMFNGCSALTTVPLFNTAAATNMSSMFYNCYALTSVPLFNTSAVTNMSSMFFGCSALTTVPLFNTASVTNMSSMFNGCSALVTIPALIVTQVNSSSNFTSAFSSCTSLSRIQAEDFRFTFSVANCNLSAAALNEIYTNLPAASGQTITVSGNYGTTADSPAIATAKGWTVSG